jgi:hypothetical protein
MRRALSIATVGALSASLAGCGLIGGIFKAGVWLGVILVVLVVLGFVMALGRRG